MTAAVRAFNGFKKTCGEFREELDTIGAQLETAASEEFALQIKHQINHYMYEEWGKISTCYDDLEDWHPEVPPELQVDVDPVPSERQDLYTTLRRKFVNTKIKAIKKVAELRRQAVSVSAQISRLTSIQLANRKRARKDGNGAG